MDILIQIAKFIAGLFSKKQEQPTAQPPAQIPPKTDDKPSEIDWNDAKCKITDHFTVEDACMLHSWNRLATEADGLTPDMKNRLVVLCKKMEEIRKFLDCPMNVHCMFRSQEYNKQVVKAIPNDVHAQGLACDFDCNKTMSIEDLKKKLEPILAQYEIRMERGTTTWIHLDSRQPGPSGRYFTA